MFIGDTIKMKTYFGILLLAILIQYKTTGQEKPQPFEKVFFEKAKINGEEASKFFLKTIHYPFNPTIGTLIDGSVFVSFIIDKEGKIDSIKVLNEANELFKEEVYTALGNSSGLWKPANFDGIVLYKKYIAAFNFCRSNAFQYKKDKSFQYYKRGDMRKALKLINEAIKIDPYNIGSYQARAMIYRKQKNDVMENHDLEKCIELNSDLLFDIWF
jgi:tetratricopeptide (TPR) repeat protein